jgi:WXG100 protein secretion system (Wss), protein YukD
VSQQLSLLIRTADQTRKAEIQLPDNLRVEQLVQQAQKQWNLPENVSYAVRLDRTGKQLDPASTLESMGVSSGDVLELYPILEAGYNA